MPRVKQGEPQKSNSSTSLQNGLLSCLDAQLIVIDDDDTENVYEETESNYQKRKNANAVSKRKKRKTEVVKDEILQEFLDHCNFYLTIMNLIPQCNMKQKASSHLLGYITVTAQSTQINLSDLRDVPVLYLYISPSPEKCLLYLERSSEVSYWPVTCSTPFDVLSCLLSKRLFRCGLTKVETTSTSCQFTLCLYILDSGFVDLSHPSDPKQNSSLHSVVAHFRGIPLLDVSPSIVRPDWAHQAQKLYESLRKLSIESSNSKTRLSVPINDLLPRLRPYQEDAVRWMLTRERCPSNEETLHPLYEEFSLLSGEIAYVNKYSGILTLQKPLAVQSSPGGILADEMGLGKTVEILACILAHPRPTESLEKLQPNQNATQFNCEQSSSAAKPTGFQAKENLLHNGFNDSSTQIEGINESSVIVLDKNKIVNTYCQLSDTDCSNEGPGYGDSNASEIKAENDSNVTNYDGETQESSGCDDIDLCNVKVENNINVVNRKSGRRGQFKASACKRNCEDSKEFFECLCGFDHWEWEWVQCTSCGSWQHKQCMSFDEEMDESLYLCPHCWVNQETPLAKSRATLVITPSAIRGQWEEEIGRHISDGSLKWMFYPGLGQRSSQFMQPLQLADHDLVLVTYETLQKEIDHVDLPHNNSDSGRRFRHRKRFMATPTPLLAVEWWRVCLDEAQMVEGVTSKTAEMALRLAAVNKWCVTGTPIQKGINDLYGLLLFLGVDPFWQRHWWNKLLYEPYRAGRAQPLLDVLKNCFWRNTKKDVLDQIGLPPQNEKTHKLLFSPVEAHFYHRQYEECSHDALQRLNKFSDLDIKLRSLDKQTMAQVMAPLSRLRQACCHPQAVRGHTLPLNKSSMKMEELLTSLIKKTKVECEEFHRQFICALNGLAGIHLINKEYPEAVEKYREVLRSVNEQHAVLKTDKMQQFHTMYNLNRILKGHLSPSDAPASRNDHNTIDSYETKGDKDEVASALRCPPGVGHTLEDDSLEEECKKLGDNYLQKCQARVTTSQEQLLKTRQALKEVEGQFDKSNEGRNWWMTGSKQVDRAGQGEILIDKVKEVLTQKKKAYKKGANKFSNISDRFNTVNGLQFLLVKLLGDLEECHNKLTKSVLELPLNPTQANVTEAIQCHLRAPGYVPNTCLYCKCHALFNKYEGHLFLFEEGFDKERVNQEDALFLETRKGTWADSQLEAVLRATLSFLKLQRVNPALIEKGNNHLKWFEALKKEFRAMRSLLSDIRDYASALDELEMAKIILRLRYEDEPKLDLLYVLEPNEVQATKLKTISDKIIAENEVRKKLGQLFYLKNLEKADFGRKGGSNPDLCPICHKGLGTEWSVTQCGHSYCIDCIRIQILKYSVGSRQPSVRCAVCRNLTLHSEIFYVDTKPDPNLANQEVVRGSHSTKVEGVVRCLLTIIKENSDAKSLVFSSWKSVLHVLKQALAENEISTVSFESQKLQETLRKFKHDPKIKVLLLPVNSGANGLNLIEATHVLMVEPLLNPAAELQALGRVHRIGQTKPTTVHRFIVGSTIEERIHRACTSYSNEKEDTMTLRELKQFFVNK